MSLDSGTWNYKYHRVIDRILNTANNLILEKTRSWIALAIVYINNGGRWYCSCSKGQGLATKRPQRKLNLGIKCTPNNTAMSWHCAGIIDSVPVINLASKQEGQTLFVGMLFDHNNYDYQKFIGTIDKTLAQKISFVNNTFIASGITIVSQFILSSTMIRLDDLIHSCMYVCVCICICMSNCTIEITFTVELK